MDIVDIEKQFFNHNLTDQDYLKELKKLENKNNFRQKTIGVFDGSMLMMQLDLKQLSLFFDQFHVIDANRWLETSSFDTLNKSYLKNRDEFQWLIETGLIKVSDFTVNDKLAKHEIYQQEMKKLNTLFKSTLYERAVHQNAKNNQEKQKELATLLHRMSTYKARIQAVLLSLDEANEAYPVIDNLNDLAPIVGDLPKSHVVNILLKKLPLPTNDTPWEQIFDFRLDDDSKIKYLRVKRWLYSIATKEIKTNEMIQEIDYLIHEYEQHMKLHKLKYHYGFLKTTILSTVEFIENCVKLKWSDATKQIFSLTNSKITLMEAEMKAPGRELSYFVKAKEHF